MNINAHLVLDVEMILRGPVFDPNSSGLNFLNIKDSNDGLSSVKPLVCL